MPIFLSRLLAWPLARNRSKQAACLQGELRLLLKVPEDRGATPRADTDTPQGRFVGAHSQAVLLHAKFRITQSADPAARDPRRYLIRSGRLAR
jgi:hypothetical protein